MRFLAFLLLGTLLFGFAFPAFILIFGFFALVILAVIIFSALRGGSFRVYTNKGFDPFRQRRESPPDDPEVLEPPDDGQYGEEPQYEEPEEEEGQTDEDSGEVVDLPPSALHKDDGEEHQDGSQRPD